jgi:transposase
MRCVPLKTTEQIELQALHRVRQGIVRERTAVVNQMRGLLLEHGIVAPVGRSGFGRRLPTTLVEAERRLLPRLLEVLHRQRRRWLALDEEIDHATRELTIWAAQSDACRRVETVPGIGPL